LKLENVTLTCGEKIFRYRDEQENATSKKTFKKKTKELTIVEKVSIMTWNSWSISQYSII